VATILLAVLAYLPQINPVLYLLLTRAQGEAAAALLLEVVDLEAELELVGTLKP
jgi:hypothetical protein